MSLYITSSRGFYKYDLNDDNITKIIGNWHKGWFKKPSKGFFGISKNNFSNEIIIVSRENLNARLKYEKSTDVIVHFFCITSQKVTNKIIIENLYDVHQIVYYDNYIFLTETGKNRIQVLNIKTGLIENLINISSIRKDLNHINAINVDNNFLFIGLNNGHKKNIFKNSQIIKISLKDIFKSNIIDALELGVLENLDGVFHTHDLEKFNDDLLVSSSNIGKIYSYKKKKFIKDIKPWARGITIGEKYIFIGKSGMGKRKSRHSRYYDGEVFVLNKFNFDLYKKLLIPKIGQLNDILFCNY